MYNTFCGMISNSICNFPGSALSAFNLETKNERKVTEKHIFYCIKKDLMLGVFFFLVGGKGDKTGGGKKAHCFGSSIFGCKPKILV